MIYKLEYFCVDSCSWYTISSSDCLELILTRLKICEENNSKEHYRVVKLVDLSKNCRKGKL